MADRRQPEVDGREIAPCEAWCVALRLLGRYLLRDLDLMPVRLTQTPATYRRSKEPDRDRLNERYRPKPVVGRLFCRPRKRSFRFNRSRPDRAQFGFFADLRFASEAVFPATAASMDLGGWRTLRLATRWSFNSPEDHRPLAGK